MNQEEHKSLILIDPHNNNCNNSNSNNSNYSNRYNKIKQKKFVNSKPQNLSL